MRTKDVLLVILIIVVIYIIVTIIATHIHDKQHMNPEANNADIIIIGYGTAGSVLIRRLKAKYPTKKIVVLERGVDRHNDRNVYNVANALITAFDPKYSELIPTDFESISAVVGKKYGGASSSNFSLHVRGSKHFYDNEWRDQIGSFDGLLPLFKAIESYNDQPGNTTEKPETRGSKGLLKITQLPVVLNIMERLGPAFRRIFELGSVEGPRMVQQSLDVAANTGPLRASDNFSNIVISAVTKISNIPIVNDYNTDTNCCISATSQLFVDGVTGLRSSLNVAYVQDCLIQGDRRNRLHIVPNAQVDTISTKNGKATGVKWGDNFTKLNEDGKVIVCAGGIYSPIILQKSNIGNALVGKGLVNHYGFSMILEVQEPKDQNYRFNSGPLGFIPRYGDNNIRDWQFITGGELLTNPDVIAKETEAGRKTPQSRFFTILFWLMRPRSRGSVGTKSDGSVDLKLNMFSDGDRNDPDSDISSLIDGIRWLHKVVLDMRRQFNGLRMVQPSEKTLFNNDPAELEQIIRDNVSITDHYSGTCKMGDVLEKDFQVKGMENVHVVDTSAFPVIPDGNTEFPTVVIAEIAAKRYTML